MISSSSSSVVVTTTSLRVDFDTEDPQDSDDSLIKPRGYFADQFEVGVPHQLPHRA